MEVVTNQKGGRTLFTGQMSFCQNNTTKAFYKTCYKTHAFSLSFTKL